MNPTRLPFYATIIPYAKTYSLIRNRHNHETSLSPVIHEKIGQMNLCQTEMFATGVTVIDQLTLPEFLRSPSAVGWFHVAQSLA